MQRLSTGDHGEGGSLPFCCSGFLGEVVQMALRMRSLRPGVLGVTPWTTDIATGQTDEEGTAAAVMAFPPEGNGRFPPPGGWPLLSSLGLDRFRRGGRKALLGCLDQAAEQWMRLPRT